jgi:hypothetical protein
MKGVKLFQRIMITGLIGLNAFVFMSMRDVSIEENILLTLSLIGSSILLFTLIAFLLKERKKKTINDSF